MTDTRATATDTPNSTDSSALPEKDPAMDCVVLIGGVVTDVVSEWGEDADEDNNSAAGGEIA